MCVCVCVIQNSMAEGEEAMGQEDWKDKCLVLEALLMKFRMQIIKIRELTADKVSGRRRNFWSSCPHLGQTSLNNAPSPIIGASSAPQQRPEVSAGRHHDGALPVPPTLGRPSGVDLSPPPPPTHPWEGD